MKNKIYVSIHTILSISIFYHFIDIMRQFLKSGNLIGGFSKVPSYYVLMSIILSVVFIVFLILYKINKIEQEREVSLAILFAYLFIRIIYNVPEMIVVLIGMSDISMSIDKYFFYDQVFVLLLDIVLFGILISLIRKTKE